MNIVDLWKVSIGKVNIADHIDMDLFANEIFTLHAMVGRQDESQRALTEELFPTILGSRDEVITPAVLAFIKSEFDTVLEPDDYGVETNAKWIPEGEGLYPHYHPSSQFSAICYPADSDTGITFFDPRGNACRGYPKEMRNRFLGPISMEVKAGDILIFPSYLQHSVSYVKEEVRLSLLHEYYILNTR